MRHSALTGAAVAAGLAGAGVPEGACANDDVPSTPAASPDTMSAPNEATRRVRGADSFPVGLIAAIPPPDPLPAPGAGP